MLSKTHSLSRLLPLIALASLVSAMAQGQTPQFKDGDRVLASPSMLKEDKYYRPCTVIKFDRRANVYLLDCEGAEYNVTPAYVRAAKSQPDPDEDAKTDADKPKDSKVKPPDKNGTFKVGDRVLASVAGVKGDKYYQPCTVIRDLENNSYGLRCDPRNGQPVMEYSVRPEWIRVWEDATPEPLPAECPFNKNYGKVSNNAAASAALFQSVIFEWQKSTSDFYDFGLSFLTFQMGKTYRNVATGRGRKLVDTAPVGATIYPVKTKELMCQKSSTITLRWVREFEYGCYKNEYGAWVCKGYETKRLEKTTIPNK